MLLSVIGFEVAGGVWVQTYCSLLLGEYSGCCELITDFVFFWSPLILLFSSPEQSVVRFRSSIKTLEENGSGR